MPARNSRQSKAQATRLLTSSAVALVALARVESVANATCLRLRVCLVASAQNLAVTVGMEDEYRHDLFGHMDVFPVATSDSLLGAHAPRHQLAAWPTSSSQMHSSSHGPSSHMGVSSMTPYAANGTGRWAQSLEHLSRAKPHQNGVFEQPIEELKETYFEMDEELPHHNGAKGARDEGGEQQRKRGRVAQASVAAADSPSVQEKNRQAQARFRQRQKVRLSLHRLTLCVLTQAPLRGSPRGAPSACVVSFCAPVVEAVNLANESSYGAATSRLRVQDKVSVLDGQVQELKLEKARLVDENKALQKSKTILEKVYALKEEQVQVLQGANGVRHQLAAELRAAGL